MYNLDVISTCGICNYWVGISFDSMSLARQFSFELCQRLLPDVIILQGCEANHNLYPISCARIILLKICIAFNME